MKVKKAGGITIAETALAASKYYNQVENLMSEFELGFSRSFSVS